MMVAKATAQRQETCSALVDATTHLLVMLSPSLIAWQQILSDRGQNTLIAPSNAKKRQPGPEICPLTSPWVRWGGAGGAARQDSARLVSLLTLLSSRVKSVMKRAECQLCMGGTRDGRYPALCFDH